MLTVILVMVVIVMVVIIVLQGIVVIIVLQVILVLRPTAMLASRRLFLWDLILPKLIPRWKDRCKV